MRKRKVFAGVLIALIAIYLARGILLPPLAGWLNVSEPRFPVDIVIPLPGGNDTRPFAAAAVFKAGLADQAAVLLTDSTQDIPGAELSMHEVTRRVLRLRGVPADDIHPLQGNSTNTYTDVQIIGILLDEQPDATVAIITSPSHTRRVRWTIRHLLPKYQDQICVVAAVEDSYDPSRWWQSPHGLEATLNEYLKLLFYAFRYGSAGQTCVFVAIILIVLFGSVRLFAIRRRSGCMQTSA